MIRAQQGYGARYNTIAGVNTRASGTTVRHSIKEYHLYAVFTVADAIIIFGLAMEVRSFCIIQNAPLFPLLSRSSTATETPDDALATQRRWRPLLSIPLEGGRPALPSTASARWRRVIFLRCIERAFFLSGAFEE